MNSDPWFNFQILGQLLGRGNHPLLDQVNAGLLLTLAQKHRVLSALAIRLEEHANVPEQLAEHTTELRRRRQDTVQKNLLISSQALKIVAALNRANITPLVLKGTARLLGEPDANLGLREQADIDLWLSRETLAQGCTALLDQGYRFWVNPHRHRAQPILTDDLVEAIKLGRHHHHLPPLVKAPYVASVEIHTHWLPARLQPALTCDRMSEYSQLHTLRNTQFNVPSAPSQLLQHFLGSHVGDTYADRHDFSLRTGLDVIQLLAKNRDETIENAAQQLTHPTALAVFISLTNTLLTAEGEEPRPDHLTLKEQQYLARRYRHPGWAKLYDIRAHSLHLLKSLRHTPRKLPGYLRRKMAPPQL